MGAAEGLFAGTPVGFSVGSGLGSSVGDQDGSIVGCGVGAIAHQRHMFLNEQVNKQDACAGSS